MALTADGYVFDLIPQVTICKNCKLLLDAERAALSSLTVLTGRYPGYGDLIWDPMGNIYGTTVVGRSFRASVPSTR